MNQNLRWDVLQRAQDYKLMVCTFCNVDVLKPERFVNWTFRKWSFCKHIRRSVNGCFVGVRWDCERRLYWQFNSEACMFCISAFLCTVCYTVKCKGIQNIFWAVLTPEYRNRKPRPILKVYHQNFDKVRFRYKRCMTISVIKDGWKIS